MFYRASGLKIVVGSLAYWCEMFIHVNGLVNYKSQMLKICNVGIRKDMR